MYRALLTAVCLAFALPGAVRAQDAAKTTAPAEQAPAQPSPPKKAFSVKNTFRNICGFCHEDYGRKAGKGPQLMNDPNPDEYLFNRIKHGKPGRMAAFGGIFSDDDIHQIVAFIRTLKPDLEP